MTTLSTAIIPKRSTGFLLGMTILMFGANIAWVSYDSILLLPLVQKVVPSDRSSLIVGLVAFAANIVGILVSLLAGILSDQSRSASFSPSQFPAMVVLPLRLTTIHPEGTVTQYTWPVNGSRVGTRAKDRSWRSFRFAIYSGPDPGLPLSAERM